MMSELAQNSSVPSCPAPVGQPSPQNAAVFRVTVPLVPNGWDSSVPTVPNTWDSVSQTVPRWWDSQTRRILRFFVSLSHHCPTYIPASPESPMSPLSLPSIERGRGDRGNRDAGVGDCMVDQLDRN